ncbi:unnamed protein product [Discosporangium mesarthrocarpum]
MAEAKGSRPLVEALKGAEEQLKTVIKETHCNPIMIRLAWHDSGTFDASMTGEWPCAGGANGSIRFEPEMNHGANAGLTNAINLLTPVKEAWPEVGWADLMQMASALSVELAGGPKIPMVYGRVTVEAPSMCAKEGNLPGAGAPFGDGSADAAEHLRKVSLDLSLSLSQKKKVLFHSFVFHRMGFNDQEIVALSGAHTLGRAYKDRSGAGAEKTKFTCGAGACPMGKGSSGSYGREGGSSWTESWLVFDNSYFTTLANKESDPELLRLETDEVLFSDPKFYEFAAKYAEDQEAFFVDYAKAHKKLSELGSKFDPEGGITI